MANDGQCPLCQRRFRVRDLERHVNSCMEFSDNPVAQRRQQRKLLDAASHAYSAQQQRLEQTLTG